MAGEPTPEPAPADPPAPKYVTAEEVAQMVTGAVHANLKKALPKAFEDLKLNELVQKAVKDAVPPPAPAPEPTSDPKPDPRLAALEQKYADLDKQYQAEKKARTEAEQKAREDKAFQDLRSALTPHVRPEGLDAAAKLLFYADKRVTFDDDGRPVMTVRKAPYQGGDEEDVQMPLADGVALWVKKDGALFAPPPEPTGDKRGPGGPRRHLATGNDGMPRYDAPANTDEEKARRVLEREQALKVRLGLT